MSSSPDTEKRYLVDTNVLLAIAQGDAAVIGWMAALEKSPARFFIGLQNICEFWNVSTRPADKNSLGLSPEFTLRAVERIRLGFRVLPENEAVIDEMITTLQAHRISGKQIYDAKLVALQRAHHLDGIITSNQRDFLRYSGANPISPAGQP